MNTKIDYINRLSKVLPHGLGIVKMVKVNSEENKVLVKFSKGIISTSVEFENYWYCPRSKEGEMLTIKFQMAEAIGDLIKLYLKGVKV